MDRTLKFIGAFVLLFLLLAHLVLLSFLFTPTDKLMSLAAGVNTALIEAEDIPEQVQRFLDENRVQLQAELKGKEKLLARLAIGVLELRRDKFMTSSERLALDLNLLHFGADIIGIEAASDYYFKKPLSEIKEAQWITLINLQKIFSKK